MCPDVDCRGRRTLQSNGKARAPPNGLPMYWLCAHVCDTNKRKLRSSSGSRILQKTHRSFRDLRLAWATVRPPLGRSALPEVLTLQTSTITMLTSEPLTSQSKYPLHVLNSLAAFSCSYFIALRLGFWTQWPIWTTWRSSLSPLEAYLSSFPLYCVARQLA